MMQPVSTGDFVTSNYLKATYTKHSRSCCTAAEVGIEQWPMSGAEFPTLHLRSAAGIKAVTKGPVSGPSNTDGAHLCTRLAGLHCSQ